MIKSGVTPGFWLTFLDVTILFLAKILSIAINRNWYSVATLHELVLLEPDNAEEGRAVRAAQLEEADGTDSLMYVKDTVKRISTAMSTATCGGR